MTFFDVLGVLFAVVLVSVLFLALLMAADAIDRHDVNGRNEFDDTEDD